MDNKIEQLFEKLFTLAESVKPIPKPEDYIPKDQPVWDHTVESDKGEIRCDIEMGEIFDRMTKRAEKLIKRAKTHNKRLPEALIASLGSQKRETPKEELDLYEKTRTMGPLKIFPHEVLPKLNLPKTFKKRGGKRRKASLMAKRWKKLTETMKEDSYCGALMKRARAEANFIKKH